MSEWRGFRGGVGAAFVNGWRLGRWIERSPVLLAVLEDVDHAPNDSVSFRISISPLGLSIGLAG